MTIKFKDAVSAQACVYKMNGRFFDGRKVSEKSRSLFRFLFRSMTPPQYVPYHSSTLVDHRRSPRYYHNHSIGLRADIPLSKLYSTHTHTGCWPTRPPKKKIQATIFTGKERFQKSGPRDQQDEDSGERERLDSFAQWLVDGEEDQ